MNLSALDKTVYAYMPETEKKRLRDFLEMNESRETLQQWYRPFLETLVKGRLRFWHKQLHKEIQEVMVQHDTGDEELNAIRDAAAGSGCGGRTILTEDMQHITRKELPQAAARSGAWRACWPPAFHVVTVTAKSGVCRICGLRSAPAYSSAGFLLN